MQNIIVDVTTFELNEDVTGQAFIAEAEKVREFFLKTQSIYLARELLRDENRQWSDILHWVSTEEAQTVARVMMQESEGQPFIQLIDLQSIQTLHLVHQKAWGL